MSASERTAEFDVEPEPRWPGFLALMTGACLYSALPARLSVGPEWMLMAVMAVLLVPILVSHRRRQYTLARTLTFVATIALTLALVGSLTLLIQGLPGHKDEYLFLAFNTSTAFSPTDTAVLDRWAKIGSMLQALISLTVLAVLAARAVNVL